MKLYGTSILLLNFGSQITRNFYLIEEKHSQDILPELIYTSLHNKVKFETQEKHNLENFSQMLASFFINLNVNFPYFRILIEGFFSHLYVIEYYSFDFNFPVLVKINNRIYLEIYDQTSYPPEILSVVTKEDYPFDFDKIDSENIYEDFHYLHKYLCKNPDGSNYLLLPEIPAKLRNQIYNLYDLLLTNFDNLDLDKKYEEAAEEIFDYLITMKEFFDTK
jgi:hypothetical protein